jgi:ATP-dependent DNA helicase RecQ
VRARGHDALPTFGVGRELSRRAWQGVVRQALGLDLLRPDPERYGGLRMTEAARPVLRGEAPVTLRVEVAKADRGPVVAKALVSDEDAGMMSALKAKRRALADALGVPAYVVFPDRTLAEMAERRPATLDQMAGISGVGAVKLERFGAAFLSVILGAPAPEVHPARRALAGQDAGGVFDRLGAVQHHLARGACGTLKPLDCAPSVLRRIAERRPGTVADLARLPGMDAARVERFGAAFIDAIAAEQGLV